MPRPYEANLTADGHGRGSLHLGEGNLVALHILYSFSGGLRTLAAQPVGLFLTSAHGFLILPQGHRKGLVSLAVEEADDALNPSIYLLQQDVFGVAQPLFDCSGSGSGGPWSACGSEDRLASIRTVRVDREGNRDRQRNCRLDTYSLSRPVSPTHSRHDPP